MLNMQGAALLLQGIEDITFLLRNTTPVSRAVLLILLALSVISWGIILSKALLFRKIRQESQTFWRIFRKGQTLSEINTACENLHFTPLVPVFSSAFELMKPAAARSRSTKTLERALHRSASAQLTLLEKRLTLLATTASVSPFIGLFGTVWGVINSFTGLANTNVASLRAVAPGIAEALIATAAGLFAAIPAVIAYNQFVYQLRNTGGEMDDLQAEILAIAEKDEA